MEPLNPDGTVSDEARAASDADIDAALVAQTATYEQAVTARQNGEATDSTELKAAAARVAALRTMQRERQIAAGTRTAGVSVNAQDNTPDDTTPSEG